MSTLSMSPGQTFVTLNSHDYKQNKENERDSQLCHLLKTTKFNHGWYLSGIEPPVTEELRVNWR